jgi:HD-like signal output (HDOD) protein
MNTLTSPTTDYRAKALRGIGQLPPFSPILNRLLASLADENVSFARLADLIEKDTVLAGNVLRLVNSALYGLRGTINSVRHAVSIMGLTKLRNTAMSLSVSRIWTQAPAPREWSQATFNQHAVAVAILADLLVQRLEADYAEGAFAAGLLHDIGLLLIAISLPREYEQIRQACHATGRPVEECEVDAIGFEHGELSAAVLERWNLPAPIQEAVRSRSAPKAPKDRAVSLGEILAIGGRVAGCMGIAVQQWAPAEQCDPRDALAQAGLENVSDTLLDEFAREYDAIRVFFK